ncbi:MAG: right-handed parallel beta-helix repeat-containing protein [Actinomycetota bacterium]
MAILVAVVLATACDPVALEGDVPLNELPAVERQVDASPAAETDGAAFSTSSLDEGSVFAATVSLGAPDAVLSAPLAIAPTRLIYSSTRNGTELGLLDGALVAEPFDARLELAADIGEIDRLEWSIDGVLFRNDDKAAPYNLRYASLVPIDQPFSSDQGLPGSWSLQPGGTHELWAHIVSGDRVIDIMATFTVAGGDASTTPPTTTVAPPTTTVAPPPTTTIVPTTGTDWSNAEASIPAGFPTAATTGFVGAGYTLADLTPSGGIDIREDGAVIDRLDVNGRIRVFADNVTIKNSRIRHESAYGIDIRPGSTGLVVEDTTIIGIANTAAANIGQSNYTCRRCNLSQAVDGAKLGTNVTIEDSIVHNMRKFAGTHNDGMQNSGGGHNVLVSGNTILGPYRTSTSAIIAQTNVGTIDNMIVTGNYMYGGSYTVYLRDKGSGHGAPTNSAITNNVFAPYATGVFAACLANSGDAEACNTKGNTVSVAAGVTWSGNVFANGQGF